jgi:hypothetical protein
VAARIRPVPRTRATAPMPAAAVVLVAMAVQATAMTAVAAVPVTGIVTTDVGCLTRHGNPDSGISKSLIPIDFCGSVVVAGRLATVLLK